MTARGTTCTARPASTTRPTARPAPFGWVPRGLVARSSTGPRGTVAPAASRQPSRRPRMRSRSLRHTLRASAVAPITRSSSRTARRARITATHPAAVHLLPLCAWRVPLHIQLRRAGDFHQELDGVGQQRRASLRVEVGIGIKRGRRLVCAGADAAQSSVVLHVQRRAVCVGAAAGGVLPRAARRAAVGDGSQ